MALMLEPGENFGKVEDEYQKNSRSMLSFARYFTPYRSMIGQLRYELEDLAMITYIDIKENNIL